MGNIHYDQKNGIGSTPDNQSVKHKGFKCWMTPDMFLRLAKRIFIDPQDAYYLLLKNTIKHGKPIGSPCFYVSWDQVWKIESHEGRHRIQIIKELWPNEAVEVHIFPEGGIRARDITPAMVQSFMDYVLAEDSTVVKNPTSEIELNGQIITPQQSDVSSGGQTPMLESQKKTLNENKKYPLDKMSEEMAVVYLNKKIIPIVVKKYNKKCVKELRVKPEQVSLALEKVERTPYIAVFVSVVSVGKQKVSFKFIILKNDYKVNNTKTGDTMRNMKNIIWILSADSYDQKWQDYIVDDKL